MKQSKTVFPKALLFFYLIPYLAVLLFTALDCVMNFAYYEAFWVKEWMVPLPEMIGYYLLIGMIYLSFGIAAYYVFFGKTWERWTAPAVMVVLSFLLPVARYLVRHIGYGSRLTNVDMLDLYNEDVTVAVTMFLYAGLALFVILAERAYYAWILRESPANERKPFSPKHPIGITMMIFFGAVAVFSTLNFVLGEDYSGAAIGSLLLEYVIDFAGFALSVFAAWMIGKWEKKATV